MLKILDYCASGSLWNGIATYVQDYRTAYSHAFKDSVTDEELLKMLKSNAKRTLPPKEYDSFRKAVTALHKGTALSLKKENLYRLCFVLELESDTQAQNLFLNYLRQNELSARSLDEFILIAALKLQLSWADACAIRSKYAAQIAAQPVSPGALCEGDTAEVYYTVIHRQIQTREDLERFLDNPENLGFFSKTRNTQYLALFDDVELELLYNGGPEQTVKLLTDYGSAENETILEYYHSLFGLQDERSEESLTDEEIASLCGVFAHVFMTYDNFCLLVQRKRPTDISSGTFLLNLLKKLLTDEADSENDFYIDFLDPEEFVDICNDILIYFGFPALNPACDCFDKLLLDVYAETLDDHPAVTNSDFQKLYLQNLRKYLRLIAKNF